MATIRDVAQKAGVSVATVSNYLNGTCPVSSGVCLRIRDAIEALQYVPNRSAKSLRSRSSREIGVLLPSLNDPYYVQLLQGIESALKGSGYFLSILFTNDIPAVERESAQALLSKQISGLILVSCQPEAWQFYYENFTAQNRPIVMIDRMIHGLDANFVSCSSHGSVKAITHQLLENGTQDILLFSGSRAFTCEADCIRGFSEAFAQHGLEVREEQLQELALSKEEAFGRSLQLLKDRTPKAIIATSGLVATGIMEALHLLNIPESQTCVISLGEEHWNRHTQSTAPVYTSRPAIRLGTSAASLLLGQLLSPLRDTEQIILRDSAPTFSKAALGAAPEAEACQPLRLLLLDAPAVRSFQGLLRNFTSQYGTEVQVTLRSHNQILSEILEHRQDYDLVMFDVPWLPSLVDSGCLTDITDALPDLHISQFLPGCLEKFCNCQDRTYAVPFLCASQILYYRKDLFENTALQASFEQTYGVRLRPPLTLKEFNGIAEFFTHKTDAVPYGISVAAAYPECFAPEIYFRLNSFGRQIYSRDNRPTFDNPQTLKAYINLLRSVKMAKSNYLQTTDYTAIEDFLRGDTAMLISYPILFPDGINLRNADIPIGYSLVPGRAPLLGGWNIGISSNCSNTEAAKALLGWLNSETISSYFTITGGQTAVTSTYTNDELTSLYPWLPLYYKAYTHAQMPPLPRMTQRIIPPEQLDAIICKWAYQAVQRSIDPQTAISRTQADLEHFLTSYPL